MRLECASHAIFESDSPQTAISEPWLYSYNNYYFTQLSTILVSKYLEISDEDYYHNSMYIF